MWESICVSLKMQPSQRKKGGIAMVTYADLFRFVMMLVAVVTLVYKITKK